MSCSHLHRTAISTSRAKRLRRLTLLLALLSPLLASCAGKLSFVRSDGQAASHPVQDSHGDAHKSWTSAQPEALDVPGDRPASNAGAPVPDPATLVEHRNHGVVAFAGSRAERPRLRYADGQIGPLEHCAVRLANKLNPRIPPCYVNGRPIGFC